jgi:hypothetical protein
MSAFDSKRTSAVYFAGLHHQPAVRVTSSSSACSACYFFIIIVIGYETTTATRWALLLIVRTLFDDAITVAFWTGFHVCLSVDIFASLTSQRNAPGSPSAWH